MAPLPQCMIIAGFSRPVSSTIARQWSRRRRHESRYRRPREAAHENPDNQRTDACRLIIGSATANESAMKELAPTGKLRVALVFAPSMSIFFVVKEARRQTARRHRRHRRSAGQEAWPAGRDGAVSEFRSGDRRGRGRRGRRLVHAGRRGRASSASRSGRTMCARESTYMVTAASGAKTVEDVDKPGMRVIGIANTTTIRAADAHAEEHDDLAGHLGRGGGRDAARRQGRCVRARRATRCRPIVKQVPGSRMTDGAFQQIGIAIAVAKGKPAALAASRRSWTRRRRTAPCARRWTTRGFADPVAPLRVVST